MFKALRQIGAVGMTIDSGGRVTLILPCNLENTFTIWTNTFYNTEKI